MSPCNVNDSPFFCWKDQTISDSRSDHFHFQFGVACFFHFFSSFRRLFAVRVDDDADYYDFFVLFVHSINWTMTELYIVVCSITDNDDRFFASALKRPSIEREKKTRKFWHPFHHKKTFCVWTTEKISAWDSYRQIEYTTHFFRVKLHHTTQQNGPNQSIAEWIIFAFEPLTPTATNKTKKKRFLPNFCVLRIASESRECGPPPQEKGGQTIEQKDACSPIMNELCTSTQWEVNNENQSFTNFILIAKRHDHIFFYE
jgi:hypothetical protein